MTIRDDGGPAFPQTILSDEGGSPVEMFAGLSIRDWFAGMAMQGLLANPNRCGDPMTHYVQAAYRLADLLLAERAKKE